VERAGKGAPFRHSGQPRITVRASASRNPERLGSRLSPRLIRPKPCGGFAGTTILIILLAPFLIGKYILLAREEDRELEDKFGEDFRHYRDTVPPFIPSMSPANV
jgi:protein-S-isoprenylcysteine O-methyltransferase Ste14